ncbi:hypothetical protein [Burkholderia multivorans]|uniref:hypothetical protein n=1 Tax=Burkholderia multivorans TaxID=87883 RepID=UPI0021BEFF28|nr:hypothetical protein [Burkholderia multivorans]
MKELLGHASLGTTMLYTKANAVRQFQSVEEFFNAALEGAAGVGGTVTATPAAAPSATSSSTPHAVVADPAGAAPRLGRACDAEGRTEARRRLQPGPRARASASSARCWPASSEHRPATV